MDWLGRLLAGSMFETTNPPIISIPASLDVKRLTDALARPLLRLRVQEDQCMDTIQHHRAMLGICRQRAQMEGENASFWLEEASIREQLIVIEERMHMLGIAEAASTLTRTA